MQLHIPEAIVGLTHDQKGIMILGKDGAIWLTGAYAEKFKANYPAHFNNAIAVSDWEHPTVTLDLNLQELQIAAHS